MDLQKMQRVVIDALEDVKAQGIKVFNTVGLSDMFDRVVVASGTSNRQTRALADSVARKVKDAGGTVVSVEGTETGEWVLVDLGDVVVHIMQPAIREYYGLEEMWGSRPVRVKLGGDTPAPRVRRKAAGEKPKASKSASPAAGSRKPAAPKSGARKTAARTTSARKATVRKASARGATQASRAKPTRRSGAGKKATKAARK
jgi:ribosome-associated protein